MFLNYTAIAQILGPQIYNPEIDYKLGTKRTVLKMPCVEYHLGAKETSSSGSQLTSTSSSRFPVCHCTVP